MNIDQLTDFEKAVLQASMAFWNYGTRDEKFDNAVAFNVNELSKELPDMTKNQIKGVVGSLFKKDLFCMMECGSRGEIIEIGITDEGIDLAVDLDEAQKGGA